MLVYERGDVRDGEATVQGTQAKIVSPTQERAMLGYLETTRYPLPAPGSRHVSLVDEGRAPRQRNGLPDLGHGDRCGRADRGGDPPPEPGQQGQDRRAHHSHAPRPAGLAHRLADRAGTRRARSRPCSSRSAAAGCRRPRCSCGSIGCRRRYTWTAARRTRAVAPS
jgi:hypothetical protein